MTRLKLLTILQLSIIFVALSSAKSHAQVKSVEVVKTLNGNMEEALFYYKNNWEQFRIEAKKRSAIDSYELLFSQADSSGNCEIMLVTTYKTEQQYLNSEKHFREIIDAMVGPTGPKFLNDIKPNQFRKRIYLNSFSGGSE